MEMILDGEPVAGSDAKEQWTLARGLIRSRRRVPSRLTVDSKDLGLEWVGTAGAAGTRVELETLALSAAAEQAYSAAAAHLDVLSGAIQRCSDLLLLGKVREAMTDFAAVCSGVSTFFAAVIPLDTLLGVDACGRWSVEMEATRPMLDAAREAIIQQDWVLVGDQLRFAWSPKFKQWRERIPAARAEAARLSAPF
jgi:hypothetical protein